MEDDPREQFRLKRPLRKRWRCDLLPLRVVSGILVSMYMKMKSYIESGHGPCTPLLPIVSYAYWRRYAAFLVPLLPLRRVPAVGMS